jgi:hypothetical protein
MQRNAVLAAVLIATAMTTGCVDRKFVVTSDPPNAAVYRNGTYIGQTPVDDPFIYYGKYEFKIVKDGFETIVEQKNITTPWYEYPPLDLVAENFFPYQQRDVRRIHFILPERVPVKEFDVLDRAQNLQRRAATLSAPNVDGALPPSAQVPGPVAPISSPSVSSPPVPATFPGPAGPTPSR